MYIYKSNLSPRTFLENIDHPVAKIYLDEINSACERFRGTEINELKYSKLAMFEKTGDRGIYEEEYFKKRKRLVYFSSRCWLFGEKEDITELEDILWAICNEFSWGLPAHILCPLADNNYDRTRRLRDLFACETASAIAETLSLCGDLLEEAVVKRCVDEVFDRIIIPFENLEADWWENGSGNWPAVCGGSVGTAAIYLIEDEARLKKITDRVKACCNRFISTTFADGSYLEGIAYWGYAMSCCIPFDELLKERLGETLVKDRDLFEKLCNFPFSILLRDKINYSFSDGGLKTSLNAGLCCKLNEVYNTSMPDQSLFYIFMNADLGFQNTIRNIAWFNPPLIRETALEKQDVFYPVGQLAVFHRGKFILGIKGGYNEEPHNHNDVGSYMLMKNNSILSNDLASPVYTGQYFSPERYTFLNANSGGHSLPIVNGCMQSDGMNFAADKFEKTENGVIISFAEAYPENAAVSKLVRVAEVSENGLTVKDSFTFTKKENIVCERILTKLNIKQISENKVAFFDGEVQVGEIETAGAKTNIQLDCSNIPQRDNSAVNAIEFVYSENSENLEVLYTIR